MGTRNELFFEAASFAVIGHNAKRGFPVLTYNGLKELGKQVAAIDPSLERIEGDATFKSIADLPFKPECAIIELPAEESAEWVQQSIDLGIKDIWIHQHCESEAALELAQKAGVNLHTGTCAVMYLKKEFTYHSIHKWIMKLIGKY